MDRWLLAFSTKIGTSNEEATFLSFGTELLCILFWKSKVKVEVEWEEFEPDDSILECSDDQQEEWLSVSKFVRKRGFLDFIVNFTIFV